MSSMKLLNVLRRPHVSEKATLPISSGNRYVFEVMREATKKEIKAAVESLFEVKVHSVNIVNVKKKPARGKGYHSAWKKAYVLLQGFEKEIHLSSI